MTNLIGWRLASKRRAEPAIDTAMLLTDFLGDLALRSSLLLGAAFAVMQVMRRASAAERHLVLVLAMAVLLVFPAALLFGPRIAWHIPFPQSLRGAHARGYYAGAILRPTRAA